MLLVALVEPRPVAVERVRVLHHELAHADEPAARARLVAELRLEVVDDHRQLAIAADEVAGELGDDLLVGHRDDRVAARAVLEPDHLVADLVVAPALLPQLGGMHDRHLHLLAADPVDLLADDLLHPLRHAKAERQQRVQPGAQLADVPGAQQQPMRRHLRLGRIVAKRGEEQVGQAHRGRIAAGVRPVPRRAGSSAPDVTRDTPHDRSGQDAAGESRERPATPGGVGQRIVIKR